jgi:hypothetical protein
VLTACGTQTPNYSFEEAQRIVLENPLIDAFLTPSANQQDFTLATTVDIADTSLKLDVTSTSQSDPATEKGTAHFRVNADLSHGETAISASGELEALVDTTTVFFNLKQLNIVSPDPTIAMFAGMAEGFKDKWFQLSLSGMESLYGDTSTYIQQFTHFRDEITTLYREQGSGNYEGIFTQFNGKPSYQFNLDTIKMETMLQELVQLLETTNQAQLAELGLTGQNDAFSNLNIRIPNFQGSFVVLGKDDVAEVVDSFEMQMSVSGENAETVSILGSYRFGKAGMVLTLTDKESNQEVIQFTITTSDATNYDVNIVLGELLTITGTATVEKKADLTVNFDLNIAIISDVETGATFSIPLKGTRGYKKIDTIVFDEPTDATDLMEGLSLLGALGAEESGAEDALDEMAVE